MGLKAVGGASSGPVGAVNWGQIGGTLSDQTDLQSALDAKANQSVVITAGAGLTGGGNLAANRTIAMSNTGVPAGNYGDASNYPVLTVNALGQVTSAGNVPVLGATQAFPIGSVFFAAVSTDPATLLGYGTWAQMGQGKFVVGFDANNANFNTVLATGGNALSVSSGTVSLPTLTMDPYTPQGTVSQPTFSGTITATSANSAGTPAGTMNAPVFTGSAATTGNTSAGTPTGNVSKPTFTGDALAAHNHELPIQIVSATSARLLANSTFGTGTSRAAAGNFTTTSNTTSAAVALTQSVSAGTPTGNVSTPTFTGDALATHNHTFTATGNVSTPIFTGTALGTHQHNVTATGTVSQPTFTGTQATLTGNVSQPTFTGAAQNVLNPFVVLYIWRRTA